MWREYEAKKKKVKKEGKKKLMKLLNIDLSPAESL